MTAPQFEPTREEIPKDLVFRTILYSGCSLSEMGNIETIREFQPKVTHGGKLDKATSRCLFELIQHIHSGKFANIEMCRIAKASRPKGRPRGIIAKLRKETSCYECA